MRTAIGSNIYLDGWAASTVQNSAGCNVRYLAHDVFLRFKIGDF